MSVHVMSAVWKLSAVSGITKLVLLKLADNANDSGECWPSIAKICRECGIDRRTAQRHIRALEDSGLIRTETRQNETGQRSNLYVLHGVVSQDDHPASERRPGRQKGGGGNVGGGVTETREGASECRPEPSVRTVKEPSEQQNARTRARQQDYFFEGAVIRLTDTDAANWSKAYYAIDLLAEIQSLDDHYRTEMTEKERKNWFTRCSKALANRHEAALRQRAKDEAEARKWDPRYGFN